MAVKQFRLPDVGEGLTEAEILGWSVAVGDEVKVNQVLVEIETAKAAVELPSPYAGVVRELLVEPGSTVDVGTPIISIETADAEPAAPAGEGGSSTGEEKREPVLVGYGVAHGSTKRRARKPAPGSGATAKAASPAAAVSMAPAPSPASPVVPAAPAAVPAPAAQASATAVVPEPITTKPTFVLAKPLVRKLAKDLGVDLTTITPEREDGVITREQVERAAAGGTAPVAAAASRLAPQLEARRIPIKVEQTATA